MQTPHLIAGQSAGDLPLLQILRLNQDLQFHFGAEKFQARPNCKHGRQFRFIIDGEILRLVRGGIEDFAGVNGLYVLGNGLGACAGGGGGREREIEREGREEKQKEDRVKSSEDCML